MSREIDRHRRLYFLEDRPEISDADFDTLVRELLELEELHPELRDPNSPSQRVGAPPADGFATRPHLGPMLSLDNAMDAEEMRAFDERLRRTLGREDEALEYVGEPKLDGAGVELIYEHGRFAAGLTRGDGQVGEDVTVNLRHTFSIPFALRPEGAPHPPIVSVRGEIVLPLGSFRRLNQARAERGEEPFANPRNAAAGSLRQLHELDRRRLGALEFRAYTLAEGLPDETVEQWEILELLRGWGFVVSPESRVCPDLESALSYHEELVVLRSTLPIEIDGTVFKLNRLAYQEEAGTLSRSPRWAIAFKFQPEQAETTIEGIEANVGRTGALTPVARLKPVQVGGVTVSNASLHNQDEIDRKDLRVGDRVVVQRAGDVIPQIVRALPRAQGAPRRGRRYRLPKHCPVCGAETVRLEGEVVTRCPNLDCPAQLKTNLRHLASRGALDIDGLGEKLVDQLVDAERVERLSDIFSLNADALSGLERMGDKSAANLATSLERARSTTLARFLIALGIRHVGATVAELLAVRFGDLDPLAAASAEELEAIEGIGPTIAESVARFLADRRNRSEIARLRDLGVHWPVGEPRTAPADGALSGKTFVLTGTLGMARSDAKRRIESAGGRVTATVSKKTDYLVAGSDPGSKVRKAGELGVKILDEAGFDELLSLDPPDPSAD